MWVVFKIIYKPSLEIQLITDHVTKEAAESYMEQYAKEFMVQEEGIKRSIILSKDSKLDPSREGYFIKYSTTHKNRIEIWKKEWTYTQSFLTGNREETVTSIGFYSYEEIKNEDIIQQPQKQREFEVIETENETNNQQQNKKLD